MIDTKQFEIIGMTKRYSNKYKHTIPRITKFTKQRKLEKKQSSFRSYCAFDS